jgi:hypothetical protein
MNLSQAYPSRYLAADDLQGRSVTVTIASVKLEEIGQGADKDTKLVLTFSGKSKALVCNKTNAKTIGKLWGEETDNWVGKPIIIAAREVEFQGNMVWAIRVSLQKPGTSAPSAAANVQAIATAGGVEHRAPRANKPQPGPDGSAFPEEPGEPAEDIGF